MTTPNRRCGRHSPRRRPRREPPRARGDSRTARPAPVARAIGRRGASLAARRDFAVILLDVQMPRLNGFETAKLIKSREHTRYVPIIFLTAISKEEEYVFEGYSVGAVDYMFKPLPARRFSDRRCRCSSISTCSSGGSPSRSSACAKPSGRTWNCATCASSCTRRRSFREIVSSAMDAIIVFDAGGTITLVNGAAERMFGTTAAHATGAPIEHFVHRQRWRGDAGRDLCHSGRAAGCERRAAHARSAAYRAARGWGVVSDRSIGVMSRLAGWSHLHADRARCLGARLPGARHGRTGAVARRVGARAVGAQ